MRFATVNESSDQNISHTLLVQIAESLLMQSTRDIPGFWETTSDLFDVFDSLALVSDATESLFHIVDEIPEAPNALAYHTVDAAGRPMLRLGWGAIKANGGSLMTGSLSLSAAMSHEVIETKVNPYVNLWADMPDGITEVAREACDPVENDSYDIDGVSVSNFVGSRWFSGGAGSYDFLGKVTAPFQMSPGGYMVVRRGGPEGQESQIFGEQYPEWKKVQKKLYGRVASRLRSVST